MATAQHTYTTLAEAIQKMIGIYGPLQRGQIIAKLKVWRRERLLGFSYEVAEVPYVLDKLQDQGHIEYAVGRWTWRRR